MKVIVELSKEEMEMYKNAMRVGGGNYAMRKIINGTPLPKGHGKIVDIKPLMIGLYEGMGKEAYTAVEIYKMLEEYCRVIIEADKEGGAENEND